MDLTQDGADDATVVSPSNTDDVIGEDYLVTDVSYDVVSEGYRVDMPVISIRCRDGDGNLATHTVDGFRPSFCIEPDDLRDDVSGVCNDRRVLGIEANFDDPFWYDFCNLSDAAMPELVAKELTANSDAVVSHVDEVDAPRETLDEDELVRIIVREPGDVSSGGGSRTPLRDEFEPTYEADVPFVNRFLIETEVYQGMAADPTADMLTYENWDGPSDGARQQDLTPVDVPDIEPRMCIFDIEVAMEGKGFPEPQRASQPINAITAYDSYRGEYIVWGLEHEDWSDDMAATLSDDTAGRIDDEYGFDVDAVRIFSDESNMLEDFHNWILDCDPDIITGWNSDDFDVPYIIQRSYNVSALGIIDWSTSGSPGVWSEEYNGNTSVSYSITGRSTLDMLEAYKKTQFRDLKSYSLEYVAQEELGRGKSDIPADKLDEAWRSDPVKFLTYNARDVQAVVEIEAAAGGDGLIALYENLRSVTGALYDTCNNNGPMLDMLFLRRAYEGGIALPTNQEPEEGKYPGARVFDVKPGLHANCVYPDLSCFTPDHDVVTPEGIVPVTDLDVGDKVYSINPDTLAVELKPVVETHEYPEYNGELVDIETSRTDLSITPNHQMLLDDGFDDDFEFIEAGDIGDDERWTFPAAHDGIGGDGIETVDITEFLEPDEYDVLASYDCHGHHFRSQLPDGCEKKRANYHHGFFFDGETFEEYRDDLTELAEDVSICHPCDGGSTFRPFKFDGDAFIELLGWFITEGNVYWPDDGNTANVKIAQENTEHRPKIEDMFDRLGLDPWQDDRAYTIGSALYGKVLERLGGLGSYNKQIPDIIFDQASLEQKKSLLDILMAGDGSGYVYYTSSEQLRDDVVRLCTEIGKGAWYKERKGVWEIHIRDERAGFETDKHKSSSTADDGVYCVTVEDNHTLLAGRNGKFQWVGQSLYPSLFSMLNLGQETIIGDRDALDASEYDEGDVFKFPVDRRDFAVVPKGESFVASKTEPDRVLGPDEHWIDTNQYQGVKSDDGGVREMFDPRFDDAFVLKPEVNESFIRSTIDELIELKYNYTGSLYSAVKRVTNCFSDDHDVQTPDGVVPIKELRPGDEVYSYDPMTGERTVSSVKTTWYYPGKSQNMIHFQSQETDLKVTPKHRIICNIDGTELELTAESVARRLEDGEDIEIPIVDGSPHANGDCLIAEDVSWDKTHTGVFCVEVVDTNTLIVGRNDTFQVASNSVYGVFGDSESGGKGFRLFHNQVASGITLAGRQVITHTAEEFTEYLQSNYDPDAEVVGGDTDSAVSKIPNAPDFDTALEWAHDAVDHVEDSYADFAQEKYWLGDDDDNRLAVDLESLASQLFFMRDPDADEPDETGVQKRYAQHVVWDEDDGWLDLPDPDETEYDVAGDPDDRSALKAESDVHYEDYMGTGALEGRDPEGDIEITGFEYVRSDAAQVTKDTQARIFTDILLHDSPRDRIEPYLNDIVDQIRAGEYDIADLARPKGMGNPVDEYGWTPIDELDDDEINETAEEYDGTYTMTPGPTYRGAKYANDHFPWEDITPGMKPQKVPIEKVRGSEYPPVYEYDGYPEGNYPESPEVGSEVDAIAMEAPERLPEQFLVDYEDIIESALKDRLEQILLTVGLDYDDLLGEGQQSSLGDWG